MPKRVPIKAAKEISQKYGCRQVILLAWDGENTHVVTYGKSLEDCDQAALGGTKIKKSFNWPEELCNTEPSRVKKLKARIAELEGPQPMNPVEDQLGLWLSAALSDKDTCEEMKEDIRSWFDQFVILCDGCDVRGNWEHRCHGSGCKCNEPVCMERQGRITEKELMEIVNKGLNKIKNHEMPRM